MPKKVNIEQSDKVIRLLQHLLAVQLYINGVGQIQIAKNLGIATANVNAMLKGIKKVNN